MSNATLDGAGGSGVETSDTLTADALVVGAGTKDIAVTDTFLVEGTTTTVGAVTGDVITLPLGGTASGYRLECMVQGFETTTPAAPGWNIMGCARTNGAAATVIGTPAVSGEADTLTTVMVQLVASGNNIVVRVTGEAALTINWRASLRYISEE